MKRRQRGSGTIERVEKQLGDGSTKVYFRARLSTPEKRKSLGFAESPDTAEAVLEAARAQIFSGDDAPRLTLRAWGLRFLERREVEGYRSIARDRDRWKQHVDGDLIADLPIAGIVRRDVLEWLDRLCAKWSIDRRRRRKLAKATIQRGFRVCLLHAPGPVGARG
jgi:hypothetical protein